MLSHAFIEFCCGHTATNHNKSPGLMPISDDIVIEACDGMCNRPILIGARIMKTPHVATVYPKERYWQDVERLRTDGASTGGRCLPDWAFDFVSVHRHEWQEWDYSKPSWSRSLETSITWSLCAPICLVAHPSCRRPQWEEWRFDTREDAIRAARWIARNARLWVVDCD